MTRNPAHPKIRPEHLRRQAIVYVRQSSPHQVRNNRESTSRQYALGERARALGWPAKSVEVIDEDQARSGTGAMHRQGFKTLLAEIGAGQVGVVLALEASRLARSSADWHRLVEICVVTQTLLADETAVYDRAIPTTGFCSGSKVRYQKQKFSHFELGFMKGVGTRRAAVSCHVRCRSGTCGANRGP